MDNTQPTSKAQAITDLVIAIETFESSTPITDFPESVSKEAKSVRARATELKDELLLLAKSIEDELSKAGAPTGGSFGEVAKPESAPTAVEEEPISRFASEQLVSRLDAVANQVQELGLDRLAAQIDIVSNSLSKK